MKGRQMMEIHRSPKGAVLVVALVCLLLVAAIGASLVRTLLLQHRQRLQERHQLQALWLAESAVQRAVARLAESADYRGETWRVDGETLQTEWSGVALIQVEPLAGDPARRRIVVAARYPQDTLQQVLQQRELVVPVPIPGESP
jgi:hypothetical protein